MVEEVVVMELVVVVGPKKRGLQGYDAWGRWHCEHTPRCMPRPTRHRSHLGPPALRVLELLEIIL